MNYLYIYRVSQCSHGLVTILGEQALHPPSFWSILAVSIFYSTSTMRIQLRSRSMDYNTVIQQTWYPEGSVVVPNGSPLPSDSPQMVEDDLGRGTSPVRRL